PEPSISAAAAAPVVVMIPLCDGVFYGIAKLGSTTAQNAAFGSPAVSNSSGRLVRVTGKELSQVWLSAMPQVVIEVTLGRLKALNSERYRRAWSLSTEAGGLAP